MAAAIISEVCMAGTWDSLSSRPEAARRDALRWTEATAPADAGSAAGATARDVSAESVL